MSELNRAFWDERVPIHVASEFYDVEGFLAGVSPLRAFEPEELGDVRGLSLVHLQCHFGLDTLSWARLGAGVTGLDFSAPAMRSAAEITGRSGLEAEWVTSDVLRADDESLAVENSYFHDGPRSWPEEEGSYAEADAGTDHNATEEWAHPLGEVVSAIAARDLRIELLHEHDFTLFARWPQMRRDEGGIYRFGPDVPSLPLMYSLLARAT